MVLALLTLTSAQLFDLGTFVRMIDGQGLSAEANPLVHFLAVDFGVPFVAVVKIVALSLVVSVIAVVASRASSHHAVLIGGVFAIAIVAGLVGGWSNAAVIL